MKILVFMSDNRNLSSNFSNAEYNSLVASINYEYCKKYGYDFIYYRPFLKNKELTVLNNCIDPNDGSPRHASWSKLLSTKIAIELDYEYIVYIDSDCIFKDLNKSLDEIIRDYINDIIFFNNNPWGYDKPCAGFYICKKSENSIKFIKNWYNYKLPRCNILHSWEQSALWEIFKEYNILIIDTWMFREREGQFLRHIGTHEKEKRIPYFKNFIEENNINFSDNISQIKCIEFDTSI